MRAPGELLLSIVAIVTSGWTASNRISSAAA